MAAAVKAARLKPQDLEPERPVSFLQSAAINPIKLLKLDAHAAQTQDAQNASMSYVVRKIHGRRNSMGSFMRKRAVLTILCDKGMPSAIMTTPLKEYQDWMRIRMYDAEWLEKLQAQYSKSGGKGVREWPYKYPPREAKSRMAEVSKMFSLLYVESVEIVPGSLNSFWFTFAPHNDGTPRKPKGFEFRPEPYVQADAEAQAAECREVILAGVLNSFLQRPVMIDRPLKAGDVGAWCERVKEYVNFKNAYGKTNLHHQVQLDVSAQEAKVVRLLEWGADPNVVYGPTQMTPLHMAASWHRTGLVTKLLAHGADAGKPDVNGLTPLHCAVVYGDPDSVRAIVQAGHGNLQGTVPTVRGDLDILDCALESEAPDAVVINIWQFLKDSGADRIGIRPVQVYPEPFPQLNLSRFLSGVISATRNRWQSHMDDQGRLHTTFEQGRETEDDLRKLRILLKMRCDPNEVDPFGRTALCCASTGSATDVLIRAGADPAYVGPLEGARQFARCSVAVHYLGTIADRTDQLRRTKQCSSDGIEPSAAELARRMGTVRAEMQRELQQVYLRSQCSRSPLLEAYAEGKVEKALALIKRGADPVLRLESDPTSVIRVGQVLPVDSDQYKRFEIAFGRHVWGQAMKVLLFEELPVQVNRTYGSELLDSKYARDRAFKGLNLPQHKKISALYEELLEVVRAAERQRGIDTSTNVDSTERLSPMEIKAEVGYAREVLSAQYKNPAARLLEEASPPQSPTRNSAGNGASRVSLDQIAQRPLSEVGTTTRNTPRIGSDYLDVASVLDGEDAASEDVVAANVSRVEQALRLSRGQSVGLDGAEKWSAYRDRVSGFRGASGAFGFDDDDEV